RRGQRWRCGVLRGRSGGLGKLLDDGGGAFAADVAGGIVDAALRESEFAAAGAGLGVKGAQGGELLLWRKAGGIYAGKLGGFVGVLQEDLAGVLEGFDGGGNREMQHRANFQLKQQRVGETDVFLDDAAFGIEQKRSGQGGDAAVLQTEFVGSDGDRIVDALGVGESLHFSGVVNIHSQTNDLE